MHPIFRNIVDEELARLKEYRWISSTEKSPVEGVWCTEETKAGYRTFPQDFFTHCKRFTFERNVIIMDKVGIICKF